MLRAAQDIDAEVLVVDNNSSDGSVEYLQKRFPNVIIIANSNNPGFGKACNQGLHKATGRYVLFLNPDTIVPEQSFSACIRFADETRDFGSLGCKMIDGSGVFLPESKRLFPTAARSVFRLTGLNRIFPRSRVFSGYYAGHLPENKISEVDVIAGAFFFAARKTLMELKGFDEDFFMYGEDIDLSYRIQAKGLKNYYFPEVTIIHFKGESVQKFSAGHRKHFYGAMKLFVKKHYSKGLESFFLNAGIGLSSRLATPKKRVMAQKTSTLAILANDNTFQQVVHQLKFADPPVFLAGRVSIQDEPGALCSLSRLRECLRKKEFDTLLVCCEDIGFDSAINILHQYKRKLEFLFHPGGGSAIVGSTDRDLQGRVIAKPGDQ